jgi:hydroxymethylpyrimidine pyrophosphatase-like HAD family hydrolase
VVWLEGREHLLGELSKAEDAYRELRRHIAVELTPDNTDRKVGVALVRNAGVDEVRAILRSTGHEVNVFDSLFMLHLIDARVDKGRTVSYLLERLGLDRDSVVAFGDADCDIPMFPAAGSSVAAANATDAVKRQASFVATHPYGRGFAEGVDMALQGALPRGKPGPA